MTDRSFGKPHPYEHCLSSRIKMAIEAGIKLGEVQLGVSSSLKGRFTNRALMLPERGKRTYGGQLLNVIDHTAKADRGYPMQQG